MQKCVKGMEDLVFAILFMSLNPSQIEKGLLHFTRKKNRILEVQSGKITFQIFHFSWQKLL